MYKCVKLARFVNDDPTWAEGCNEVRDWLERRVWDVLTDYVPSQGDLDEANAVKRCPTALIDNLETQTAQVSASEPERIQINPTNLMMRYDDDGNCLASVYAGFYRGFAAGPDCFLGVLLHESRHCWQYTLPAPDVDGDWLYDRDYVPTSSADLFDAPNAALLPGGSGDGHFRGDGIYLGDDHFAVHIVHEHNALRFEQSQGLLPSLECAYSTFEIIQGAVSTGTPGQELPDPIRIEVRWPESVMMSPRNYAGVTVKAEVIDPSPQSAQISDSDLIYGDEVWGMTTYDGTEDFYVRVGDVDTAIRISLIPPMAPQSTCPFLNPSQPGVPAGQVIAYINVQQ